MPTNRMTDVTADPEVLDLARKLHDPNRTVAERAALSLYVMCWTGEEEMADEAADALDAGRQCCDYSAKAIEVGQRLALKTMGSALRDAFVSLEEGDAHTRN